MSKSCCCQNHNSKGKKAKLVCYQIEHIDSKGKKHYSKGKKDNEKKKECDCLKKKKIESNDDYLAKYYQKFQKPYIINAYHQKYY